VATLGPRLEASGSDGVAKQVGFPRQPKSAALAVVGPNSRPPKWIKPQLTRLVEEAPTGADSLHEIKYDGYRMHARIDGDQGNRLELVPPIPPTIEVIEEEG
jgi:ATP-dependent DNA ligase